MVLKQFNSFDKNLQFTVDTFIDNNIHFLDISIDGVKTDVYYKSTHTGQYCDFTSQTPWSLKTAWVKSLISRSQKICSTETKLKRQLSNIRKFMSWNNYPSHVRNSLIKRQLNKTPTRDRNTDESKELIKIYIKVPYLGKNGEYLVRTLKHKLKRYTKQNVKFISLYQTKKTSMFCPTKDKTPVQQKSNVIYKLVCPGCNKTYVGKTDRCFYIRMKEHGTRTDQPMHNHLENCKEFHSFVQLFTLPQLFHDDLPNVDYKEHILNAVLENAEIIDRNDNWSQLCFLEAYYIKQLSPEINNGLKASKELQLFR